eukprot:jgi/Botrbrau1/20222/Bobra.31_1s0019.1
MAILIHFFVSLIFIAAAQLTKGEIVGSFVLPHGGIAIGPQHFKPKDPNAKKQAQKLHEACVLAGQTISSLAPDTIVLSTPHGIADLDRFALYLNPQGKGSADTDNCACPTCCYEVSVKLDVELAQLLLTQLRGANLTGLSAFGPPGQSDEAMPLKWGEVIPLHFVGQPTLDLTKVVILSQPSRRYDHAVDMIPELLRLGDSLWGILHEVPGRVLLVISADLAHTHDKDGPYGFDEAAEPFDKSIGAWARGAGPSALLEEAAGLVKGAKSCGYTGLVMLEGLLQASGIPWQRSVLAGPFYPSYYGMLVASFLPQPAPSPASACSNQLSVDRVQ